MEGHLRTLVSESLSGNRPLSVLVADIDHFKRINDTYGHDAGDHVLREFANRFRRNTRGVDLACRFGGEEFVTIMPDTTPERAYQVAERLRACIAAEPFRVNASTSLALTTSVGISVLERFDETPETLFKRADNALYKAKREGRNRVVADAA
jgi:two-component system, cell cycle response regulator